MRRAVLLAVLVLTSCTHRPADREPSLAAFIERQIDKPPFSNALWGIRVEDASGAVLFDHNSHVLMMPASNRKVFVAALAAECLGPGATLKTELWLDGAVHDGVLTGNLVVKGGGDPTLGGRYEADRDTRLMPFLNALGERGIQRVAGSVVADVSLFSRETVPGSWKTDNLGSTYAAPVDAIAYNENAIGVTSWGSCDEPFAQTDPAFVPVEERVACGESEALSAISDEENHVHLSGTATTAGVSYRDTIAIGQPALYAAQTVTDFLERNGIAVAREPGSTGEVRSWSVRIATIESPPVFEIAAVVLKNSQNLYSEMLLRAAAGGAAPISYEQAFARERLFLTSEVGLDGSQFGFADGSGLSVENMVTPRAIVQTFRYLWEPPRRELFRALLATPGESGTLRQRLGGMEATMRGKTGTIDGVSALSGYVLMPEGDPRFFAILVNHHLSDSDHAEEVLDRIARRIAQR